jgi:elongation factor Tu
VGLRDTLASIVTGIERFRRKSLKEAVAGNNVVCFLSNVTPGEVDRGQVLCAPGTAKPHKIFTAELYVLTRAERGSLPQALEGDELPKFYFRSTDVAGRLTLPEGRALTPGENVTVRIELIVPVAMEQNQRFGLRQSGRIFGMGVVVSIHD